jgi:hypothetical protein
MMDDARCDSERLLRTVGKFRLINLLLTRYRRILRRWLLADMLADPERTYRIADLGAGGCDIPAWLLEEGPRWGLRLSVLAVEADERVAAHAAETWRHTRGLEVPRQDATDLAALGKVDYIISNHFLDHLQYGEIGRLLRQAAQMPIRRFIFMDLLRSYLGFYVHSVYATLLCRGTFAGEDVRRSIRRGFSVPEIAALLGRVGLQDRVHVYTMTPVRSILVGERTGWSG